MSDLTPEILKDVLKEVLGSENMVGVQTHNEHHLWVKENKAYLDAYIAKEARRQEQWQKIKGSVVVAIILGSGTIIYKVINWIWQHLAKDFSV